MIIYLEGVDGSGKTRLANYLYENINKVRFKIEPHGELNINTKPGEYRLPKRVLLDELNYMAYDDDTIYIVDRGPLSDIIYRAFDKIEPVISLTEMLDWCKSLRFSGRLEIIHCSADKSKEDMLARGDDNPVALSFHDEINYLYDQLMPLFTNLTYNWKKDNTQKLLERVSRQFGIY